MSEKTRTAPVSTKKGTRNSARMNGKASKSHKGEPASRNNGKTQVGYSVKHGPEFLAKKIEENDTKPARRKAAKAARRMRTAPPHSVKAPR